jgi:lipid-binding SYLF domain-containing protein
VFAGLSLGGVDFTPDNNANQRLYGKTVSASEIVSGNSVQATTAGQAFASLLDSKVATHTR